MGMTGIRTTVLNLEMKERHILAGTHGEGHLWFGVEYLCTEKPLFAAI